MQAGMALALALAAAISQAPPAAKDKASQLPPVIVEFSEATTFYYEMPDPKLGPKLLREMLKAENVTHPWFQKRPDVWRVIGSQIGDIAAGKPEIVRQYEEAYAIANPTGRRVIIRSLLNCGDDETIKKIDGWIENADNAELGRELRALKEYLSDPNRVHVRDRRPKTPHDLDLLWGNFFITGEYRPVARIVDVLDQPDVADNYDMKRVVRWSLESNLRQHPKLDEMIRKDLAERKGTSRKELDQILADVAATKKKVTNAPKTTEQK
jgi:hypothetical protein